MKILVFSDSHGVTAPMLRAVQREDPDHILHLGDYVRDAQALRAAVSVPVTNVAGNCDPYGAALEIQTPEFLGKRLYMTHGHLHGVKTMYMRAIYAALEAEADILLFGHTHRAECFREQGLWVMNPGAAGTRGSYGIIQLTQDDISCQVKDIQ